MRSIDLYFLRRQVKRLEARLENIKKEIVDDLIMAILRGKANE
jgi:hypothetical protein